MQSSVNNPVAFGSAEQRLSRLLRIDTPLFRLTLVLALLTRSHRLTHIFAIPWPLVLHYCIGAQEKYILDLSIAVRVSMTSSLSGNRNAKSRYYLRSLVLLCKKQEEASLPCKLLIDMLIMRLTYGLAFPCKQHFADAAWLLQISDSRAFLSSHAGLAHLMSTAAFRSRMLSDVRTKVRFSDRKMPVAIVAIALACIRIFTAHLKEIRMCQDKNSMQYCIEWARYMLTLLNNLINQPFQSSMESEAGNDISDQFARFTSSLTLLDDCAESFDRILIAGRLNEAVRSTEALDFEAAYNSLALVLGFEKGL